MKKYLLWLSDYWGDICFCLLAFVSFFFVYALYPSQSAIPYIDYKLALMLSIACGLLILISVVRLSIYKKRCLRDWFYLSIFVLFALSYLTIILVTPETIKISYATAFFPFEGLYIGLLAVSFFLSFSGYFIRLIVRIVS